MEILGRSARLPENPTEWALLGVVFGVLFISARFAADLPTAVFGVLAAIVAFLFDARIFIPATMAIAAWLALICRGRTVHANPRRRVFREAIYLFGGFALYEMGRHLVQGGWQEASANGATWLSLERRLRIDLEHGFQQWVLQDHTLVILFNSIYSWAFLSIVVAAVFWTLIVDDYYYRLFRNSLGVSCALAVMIMALHPTAPPRMLPGSEIIGTHALVGGSHSFVNQFAAIPSLHVGWLALTGVILFWAVQSKWRWFWLLAPVAVMQFTVMATGHHYLLDGVVGSLIAVGPALVMHRSRQPAAQTASSPASGFGPVRWITAAAKEIADQPKVKLSFYGLGLILVYLLARHAVDPGFTNYWGYQIFQISVTLIFVLAVSVHFSAEGGLSWVTHVIIVLTTWADSLGTAGHMYDRHASYDKVTHYMGSMAAACLVCDLLFAMNRRGSISWQPYKIVAFGFMLSFAAAATWEIYEYYGDILFDTGRWAGQWDTTYDLISDAIGAFAGAILVGWINVTAGERQAASSTQQVSGGRLKAEG